MLGPPILLASSDASIEEVIKCIEWLRKSNAEWYDKHGIGLADAASNWDKFKSTAAKQQSSKPTNTKDAPAFLSSILHPIFKEIKAGEGDALMMTHHIQLNYLETCPKMSELYFKHLVSGIMATMREKYTGEELYGDDAWHAIFDMLSDRMKRYGQYTEIERQNRENNLKYRIPTYKELAETPVL